MFFDYRYFSKKVSLTLNFNMVTRCLSVIACAPTVYATKKTTVTLFLQNQLSSLLQQEWHSRTRLSWTQSTKGQFERRHGLNPGGDVIWG